MSAFDPLLSDYCTHQQTANELNVTRRTLDRWEILGEGPPITRIGRRIFYRRSSLQAWLRARERKTHEQL